MKHVERVMGTAVSFDVRGGTPGALADACGILHRADAVFSTWEPDSPMSRLRRGELSVGDAPEEIAQVLDLCAQAKRLSGGWFDPWGMPGGVDPTGLVKGWAAQRAADTLRDAGAQAAMVNAAGDIVTFGEPEPGRPWRLGIRDPRAPDRIAWVVAARDGAVATSAAYERGAHVLDPHTGGPARAALSATVTGPDLTLADALATGLFAAGAAGLPFIDALPGYDALVVGPGGDARMTDEFPLRAPLADVRDALPG
ncbi:MAG: FAD:protein transferase [Thermoleophilaceae bacterium]|nr:FAD:protein transferase [Thermoleophilaceae bacterium]